MNSKKTIILIIVVLFIIIALCSIKFFMQTKADLNNNIYENIRKENQEAEALNSNKVSEEEKNELQKDFNKLGNDLEKLAKNNIN